MINNFVNIYNYVGPSFIGLLPISLVSMAMIIYVSYATIKGLEINSWVEISLAYMKETAALLGLLGSVYALAMSFQMDNFSAESIRKQMFQILSTGFWSTFAGILISIEASIGLLIMKKV